MKENIVKTVDCKEQGEKSDIVDIANEDWPMLQDINKTRYTIKNKRNKNGVGSASLAKMKQQTEKEDLQGAQDVLQDEAKVEQYFKDIQQENTKSTIENVTNKNDAMIHHSDTLKIANKEYKETESYKGNKLLRLFTLGLAKIYIRKTSMILDPLSFVLENKMKVFNGILQTIIPALMTWYLVTNFSAITTQLAKETNIMKVGYVLVFYFACMFIWITGQVIVSGLYHILKKIGNEIINEGYNQKK